MRSINQSNHIIKTAWIGFSKCVNDVMMTSCDVDNNGVGGLFFLHDVKNFFQKCNFTIKTLFGLKTAAKDIYRILKLSKALLTRRCFQ